MHRLHCVALLAAVLRASCLAPVPRRVAPSRAPGAAAVARRAPRPSPLADGRQAPRLNRAAGPFRPAPLLASSPEASDDLAPASPLLAVLSVAAAAAFGLGVYAVRGPEAALEFSAGYVVEQSLSVDNLLVFLVLFDYFRVPAGPMQDKALAYGLYGAVVCRGVFVGLGAVALAKFRVVLLAFAGLLIFTSAKILLLEEGDGDEDVSDNAIVRLVNSQSVFPATDKYDADDPSNFFTLGADGVKRATPLLAAVACLELSDVVFAVDSVPAVFGVTEDPFLVYTSNMFAILGLRAWYGVLSKAADDLAYLEKAVAVVLGFVGLKLGFGYFGYDIETGQSLAVIATVLGAGILASIYFPPDEGEESP